MKFFLKVKLYVVFISLFLLSILPFCFNSEIYYQDKKVSNELFKSELSYLNSEDTFVKYIDSVYESTDRLDAGLVFDTALYVQIASEHIKQRFSYGLIHYRFSENWIAALAGKLLWSHLSAIVNPEDILKYTEGLCSQQTIVFMEVLKKKGINVRSVGLGESMGPGHFLCEVHYNDSWRLHDVTKEPEWKKIYKHHESMNYYLNNKDSLYKVYEYKIPKVQFEKILKKVEYGEVNKFPATNMLIFHRITKTLTYFFPVIFFLLFLYSFKKR